MFRRDSMLEFIRREIPELYNFTHATCNVAKILQFGEFTICSEEGPHQGDPLSSGEFCLTIHPLLGEFKMGYLNDVTLSWPSHLVLDDIETIISKSWELGLELNAEKCKMTYGDVSTPHNDLILSTFQRVELEDLTLFGAPIMSWRAVHKALREKPEDGEGDVQASSARNSWCPQPTAQQYLRFEARLHASHIRMQRQSAADGIRQVAASKHHRCDQRQREWQPVD